MAGHSKRHNIKHRKAAQDAKRSKIYANVAKVIQMAAKWWDDPSLNPVLEQALVKARQAGLPKHVIQKAVDKGSGKIAGEELVEIFYEWYGIAGVALYIKCITGNTNRSASSVKSTLVKYGGSMGAPGSVSRQFTEKWEIYVSGKWEAQSVKWKEIIKTLSLDQEAFEIDILETAAEDYEIDEEEWEKIARVVTSREDFVGVVKFLEEQKWKIENADLVFLADNTISLDTEQEEKLQRLIDAIEENEDVDTVRHNAW